MGTASAVVLGAKEAGHQLDTTGLLAQALVVLATEVSEDAGKTWRSHGSVSVRKSEMVQSDPFVGAPILFLDAGGNNNPGFMVRTTATVDGVEPASPLVPVLAKVITPSISG
jgi:hypothetical protein